MAASSGSIGLNSGCTVRRRGDDRIPDSLCANGQADRNRHRAHVIVPARDVKRAEPEDRHAFDQTSG
jgi:hypothetical protein